MDRLKLHKHRKVRPLIGLAIAALSFGVGCSSAGLHLPDSMWSHQRSAAAPSVAADDTVAAPPAAAPPSGDTVDSVVASVDGNPITSHDVKTFTAPPEGNPATAGQTAPDTTPTDPSARLKALITQQLIAQEAQKYADKVDDAEVDQLIQGIEARNHLSDEQLRAQLQMQGISYDKFRANIRRQAQAMAMFQHEVREKVAISDADIKSYYDEHPDEFVVTDEKYRLAQILIAVPPGASPDQVAAARDKAEKIRKQILNGKDFGDLARQYSDDNSKSKGGELGVFNPNDLNDDIAAGIKNLKPGDVSPVIRTKYGFHIIKVEAHQVPGKVQLADVKEQIRTRLQNERAKDEFQKWVDQDLVKEHYVETTE